MLAEDRVSWCAEARKTAKEVQATLALLALQEDPISQARHVIGICPAIPALVNARPGSTLIVAQSPLYRLEV